VHICKKLTDVKWRKILVTTRKYALYGTAREPVMELSNRTFWSLCGSWKNWTICSGVMAKMISAFSWLLCPWPSFFKVKSVMSQLRDRCRTLWSLLEVNQTDHSGTDPRTNSVTPLKIVPTDGYPGTLVWVTIWQNY